MHSKHTYPYVLIGLLFTRLMYNNTYTFCNEILIIYPQSFWVVQLVGQNLRKRQKKKKSEEKWHLELFKFKIVLKGIVVEKNRIAWYPSVPKKTYGKRELLKVSLWSFIVHMMTHLKLILAILLCKICSSNLLMVVIIKNISIIT